MTAQSFLKEADQPFESILPSALPEGEIRYRLPYLTSTAPTFGFGDNPVYNAGRLARVAGDVTLTYYRNAVGMIQKVQTQPVESGYMESSVSFEYDALGRIISTDLVCNGTTFQLPSFVYGTDGQLQFIKSRTGDSFTIAKYTRSNSIPLIEELGGYSSDTRFTIHGEYRSNDAGQLHDLSYTQSTSHNGTVLTGPLFREHLSYIDIVGIQTGRITSVLSNWPDQFVSNQTDPLVLPPTTSLYALDYDGYDRMVAASHSTVGTLTCILPANGLEISASTEVPLTDPVFKVLSLTATFNTHGDFGATIQISIDGGHTWLPTSAYGFQLPPGQSTQVLSFPDVVNFDEGMVYMSSSPPGTTLDTLVLTGFGSATADGLNTLHDIAYDKNSNISQYDLDGVTQPVFTFNLGTNQCTSFGAKFDLDGNVSSYTPDGGLPHTSMQYDILNKRLRLFKLSNDPQSVAYNTYFDGEDRKVYATRPEGSYQYVYGLSDDPLLEIFKPTSGSPMYTLYCYGVTGLIAFQQSTNPANMGPYWFVVKDHLGSTRVVVSKAGDVIGAFFNYRPFGELLVDAPSPARPSSFVRDDLTVLYRFTGREWEESMELYYFKARMYDPAVFRFLSPDPAHQFASPYIYSPNPVGFIDPTGQEAELPPDECEFQKQPYHAVNDGPDWNERIRELKQPELKDRVYDRDYLISQGWVSKLDGTNVPESGLYAYAWDRKDGEVYFANELGHFLGGGRAKHPQLTGGEPSAMAGMMVVRPDGLYHVSDASGHTFDNGGNPPVKPLRFQKESASEYDERVKRCLSAVTQKLQSRTGGYPKSQTMKEMGGTDKAARDAASLVKPEAARSKNVYPQDAYRHFTYGGWHTRLPSWP